MKKILLALALCISIPSFAQQQQGQTTSTQSTSGAVNAGVSTEIITNNPEQRKHTSVDTTPSAIAPTVMNSSGTYTCFGGASGAVGFTGFNVGGGKTVSQVECYRLHLMDKSAQRAATEPAFAVIWDSLFCEFPDGAKAYELAGKECPQAKRAREQAAMTKAQQDAYRATIPSYPGYTGSDPVVIERLRSK